MLHGTGSPEQTPSSAGPDLALVVVDESEDVVDALQAAATSMPGTRLVVMTALGGPDALVGAVAAGADGWLPPSACDHGLGGILTGIARGESGFSRADTTVLVQALRRELKSLEPTVAAPVDQAVPPLTPREQEVYQALQEGRSTREVAVQLNLSEVTVRWHAGRVGKKLALGAPAPVLPERTTQGGAGRQTGASRSGVRQRPVIRSGASGKGLSAAETRVALLVAEGLSNRQIAEQLFISRHTVESHLKHAFVKLRVRSRVELTRIILESGTETG